MDTSVKKIPDPPPRNPLRLMSIEKSMNSQDSHKSTVLEGAKQNGSIQSPMTGKPDSEFSEMTGLGVEETKVNGLDVKEEISSPEGRTEIALLDRDGTNLKAIPEFSSQTGNEELLMEIDRLRNLLEKTSISNTLDITSPVSSTGSKVELLENELRVAKELIQSLKVERKKLRSDKNDLLKQVKHLCASLQEKEQELRNFIRNFEQRIRDSEETAAKTTSDNEHDRWTLIKHAHDEAERSLALAAQLNVRDLQLQRAQEQLMEARRQLSGCVSDQESIASLANITSPSGLLNHGCDENEIGMSGVYLNTTAGDRGSCSADSGVRGSSDRESAAGDLNLSDGPCENDACITVDSDSISLVSSHHNVNQYGTPKEYSPSVSPLNTLMMERPVDLHTKYGIHQDGTPADLDGASTTMARRLKSKHFNALVGRTGRGGAWGSISRVFARSKKANKSQSQEQDPNDMHWSPLTEENYAEKLRLLREASAIPLEFWRPPQIIAWLEVALGMPKDCLRLCSENVKSGKVLLELSDAELESGLGATHPMHRKKLRLAIEEQRRPELIRFPTITQLSHSWTALEWLHDIGLSQYSETFLHSLVDARMLDTLSKKELEKYLGVTRKFHQASIVHGIHLLRLLKYDRQALAMRRMQCENSDSDPIVWTNQRFIRWVRSIDLGEYADNLRNSGVHGGLVILESSFSGETMATALGINPAKNIVRRHLITEFESLILPARTHLTQGIRSGGGISSYDRNVNNGYYANQKAFKAANNNKSLVSPTHSFGSSDGGGYYQTSNVMENTRVKNDLQQSTGANESYLSVMSSTFNINNYHRISAPPTMEQNSTLPRYSQYENRRVKSISDFDTNSRKNNQSLPNSSPQDN